MPLQHHVFAGERLTAFSDAVFAIVATIMVIPLKLTDTDMEEQMNKTGQPFNLADYITNQGDFLPKVFTYFFAFMIVLGSWYSHNRIFRVAEYVDDFLSWLNLLVLLLVSLLPAVVVLIGSFYSDRLVITLAAGVIISTSIALGAMVYVAVRQKSILHPHIARNMEMKQLKLTMYLPLLINPIFALLSVLFAWTVDGTPEVGVIFLSLIAPSNLFIKLGIGRLLTYCRKRNGRQISNEVEDILKNYVTKERTLTFSDGIFSIVATIIVLDITTIKIPQLKEHHEIVDYLDSNKYEYVSYFSSFMIVGLLWFVHHSMFHFIKKVNIWITIFNSISLMFVGLIPFGTGVVSEFTEGANTSNEITSIRIMSLLLVLASSTQLLLWSVAHCQKSKCLSSEVDGVWMELIQIWKLLIFPIMGLIVYFVSFTSRVTVHHFYSYSTYTVPFLFILPRVLINILYRTKKFKPNDRSSSIVSEHYSRVHIQEDTENDHLLLADQRFMTTRTFKDRTSLDISATIEKKEEKTSLTSAEVTIKSDL